MCIESLSHMEPGQTARVESLTAPEPMRRRLMDIGFTRGTTVRALYRAGRKGPTAYAVRGAVIALRARDAQGISVRRGGDAV